MFNFKKIIKSFHHAGRGLRQVFHEEQNFRLQILAAAVVLSVAFYLGLKNWEIIILILMITLVLVLELINSILERLVDIVKPGIHEYARAIKDIMAAAVFIASFSSLLVGILIFLPYF